MTIVFLEGKFIEESEASIPLTDRGFLFGDGIFTTMRVFEGKVEGLKTHLIHLQSQCAAINIEYPTIKEEWLYELVKQNQAFRGIWRLKIFVTGGDCRLLVLQKRQGRLIMTLKPVEIHFPEEACLGIYPIPFSSPLASVKSLSYLDRLHMADYASRNDVDDVAVLSPEGYLLETSFANLFWKEGDAFFSPEPSHQLLQGATLFLIAKEINIFFVKKRIEEISQKAQVFLCNSIRGIIPVKQIGKYHFFRDLKLEKFLHQCYLEAISKDLLI